MSNFVVGLTGGIGSGKTAVSDLFAQKGISVVDADIIAREVVQAGSPALGQIAQRFGRQAILASGELNRGYLREVVFAQPEHKQWLDNLLHPLIRVAIVQQVAAATSPYCILAVPLLVENKMAAMVNRVLVVDVDEIVQLSRASARDGQSTEQIKNIMANQATRAQRLALADDVVDNNGLVGLLNEQVDHLDALYQHLAAENNACKDN
ncbi:dephospho-CoA kinase [Aliiglaciecola sp. LCG003]|uniref:dephospho-CoA kinase n=1 Tax=Aliiglaciecola sp. LCG003 TaxID=3053655 RepID=UPI002573E7D5|nr:dephospho-CoA kinase [Aliiglaciecola sp. LCG003]WJG10198.1 dephospho-CoA kinase [Aliiglaciecola sp. LCG003]